MIRGHFENCLDCIGGLMLYQTVFFDNAYDLSNQLLIPFSEARKMIDENDTYNFFNLN